MHGQTTLKYINKLEFMLQNKSSHHREDGHTSDRNVFVNLLAF